MNPIISVPGISSLGTGGSGSLPSRGTQIPTPARMTTLDFYKFISLVCLGRSEHFWHLRLIWFEDEESEGTYKHQTDH